VGQEKASLIPAPPAESLLTEPTPKSKLPALAPIGGATASLPVLNPGDLAKKLPVRLQG
jgi:hypothetical protein